MLPFTPPMFDRKYCWHFEATGLPCMAKSNPVDGWCDEHRPLSEASSSMRSVETSS